MRSHTDFNDGWIFHEGFAGTLTTQLAPGEAVRLPHNAVELPFSYFDERTYQRVFTYQKVIEADPAWTDREVTLVFDGAMANAVVYLKGDVKGEVPADEVVLDQVNHIQVQPSEAFIQLPCGFIASAAVDFGHNKGPFAVAILERLPHVGRDAVGIFPQRLAFRAIHVCEQHLGAIGEQRFGGGKSQAARRASIRSRATGPSPLTTA